MNIKPLCSSNTSGFTIVVASIDRIHFYFNQLRKESLSCPEQIVLIQKETSFLPFLTLHDNLLIGLKKEAKSQLKNWLSFFQLDMQTLQKSSDQIKELDLLKLQLIRALLTKKTKIFLNQSLDCLSVYEIQQILPTLHNLSQQAGIHLVLFTQNPQIAKTSFCDCCIHEPSNKSNVEKVGTKTCPSDK
ncbi:hypothetical protein ACFFIF_00280 [Vagococcus entomophilus]|uniref:ABC transporter domain-containing protein n=1 Tax=Vagococcus entomophilus TaxID=1160095 RepID=A0A430AKU2_9ENTE|nr:hypothetical protein [Vagococcus entomophilus]RSU08731.1 hypothetical protein CBF30_05770 [Vagococcus entomophilus]